MKSCIAEGINPRTMEIEEAILLLNHFGVGRHGAQFPSDGLFNKPIYRIEDCAAQSLIKEPTT